MPCSAFFWGFELFNWILPRLWRRLPGAFASLSPGFWTPVGGFGSGLAGRLGARRAKWQVFRCRKIGGDPIHTPFSIPVHHHGYLPT
jgi:hypothetical protein